MLKNQIENRENGILLYGITPPRANNDHEKVTQIAQRHINRIQQLDIDGLIIYDIQDESARTGEERPFEFIRTIEPSLFSNSYLKELSVPRIVYKCVGNYTTEEFSQWLTNANDQFTVFVGTAASDQEVLLRLPEAYGLRKAINPNILLGAVTIPERHITLGDEPQRVLDKMVNGCSFFVTQCVYDVEASKAFLRDYKQHAMKMNQPLAPIVFTLTPCGSEKTLKFIKWLGISVPEVLENTLLGSDEMLPKSIELCEAIYKELAEYAKQEDIPIGCNVESVSIRKEEIDASIQLAKDIRAFQKTFYQTTPQE